MNVIVECVLVKLPEVEYDPVLDNRVVNDCNKIPLRVKTTPVCTTYAIFEELSIKTKIISLVLMFLRLQ